MEKKQVKVYNKSGNELPKYETIGAAGFDFKADFSGKEFTADFKGECFEYNPVLEELTIFARGGRVLIPTGLFMQLPDGYELQVRGRSGLGLKYGITMGQGVGTIDEDYRGEIGCILLNTGMREFKVKDGDRVGQGVLCAVEQIEWVSVGSVEELSDTERGGNGFGHTGKN